jgi:hypothetical protein
VVESFHGHDYLRTLWILSFGFAQDRLSRLRLRMTPSFAECNPSPQFCKVVQIKAVTDAPLEFVSARKIKKPAAISGLLSLFLG